MESINEGSSVTIELTFEDENGDAAEPMQVFYAIHDKGSLTQMLPLTEVEVEGSTYNLEIDSEFNYLVDPTLTKETRIITVKVIFSGDKVKTSEYRYKVVNLIGIEEE